MNRARKTKLFDNLPEPVRAVSWMFEPMLAALPLVDKFDPRAARTGLRELNNLLERVAKSRFAAVGPDELVSGLIDAMEDEELRTNARQGMAEACRQLKSAASEDPRYSLLVGLAAEVDQHARHAALLVLGQIDLPAFVRRECEPVEAIQNSFHLRGERRARAVRQAIRDVVEMLYDPYLRKVCNLAHLARKEPPAALGNTGTVVQHAVSLLPKDRYPGLVDPDASFLRNAVAHGHFDYDPGADTMTLWDTNRPPQTFPVEELRDRMWSMYTISGRTFRNVAVLYMLRNLHQEGGLVDQLVEAMPRLNSTDPAVAAAAAEEMDTWVEVIFGPVRDFLRPLLSTGSPRAPACVFCKREAGSGHMLSQGAPGRFICDVCLARCAQDILDQHKQPPQPSV